MTALSCCVRHLLTRTDEDAHIWHGGVVPRLVLPGFVALLLLGPSAAGAATPVSFAPEQTYPSGDLPYSVETADLNGDGILDVVSANTISDDISVLLGRGGGRFAAARTVAQVDSPRTAVTADFDEDGRVDVAVSDVRTRGVSVLRGDGRGGLGSPVRYAVGEQPRTVVTSDFDRDRHADLAVVNRIDDTISVLLGHGDGTFAAARTYPAGDRLAAGGDGDAYDVEVVDVNRDGAPDLAVANRASNNVSLLLGDGDGGFRPGAIYPVGRTPYDVEASDLDGDGEPDLAVGNGDSRDISILLGRGDGTFTPRPPQGEGLWAFALSVADVDGDGHEDLAVASNPNTKYVEGREYAGSATVLLGRGDGTFGARRDYGVGPRPVAITAEDLDGDGRADLATANRGSDDISVLLRAGSRLEVASSPRRLDFPATVALRGRLTSADGRPLPGRRVVLEQRPWVRGAFSRVPGQPAGGVAVAADGTFGLAGVRPEWTTDYRVRFDGDPAAHDAAISPVATTQQRPRVTLRTSEEYLAAGRSRLLSGSVSHHSHAGLPVTVVIRRDGRVVERRRVTLGPSPLPRPFGCVPAQGALCPPSPSLAPRPVRGIGDRARPEPAFGFAYRPSRAGVYTFVARFGPHPPGHLASHSAVRGFLAAG